LAKAIDDVSALIFNVLAKEILAVCQLGNLTTFHIRNGAMKQVKNNDNLLVQ
jgi:hypothetical protein